MIVSEIIGGLGNQMFQYAAGRALALERGVELKLDISGFQGYALHQGFELDCVFNCPSTVASLSEIHRILGWQGLPFIHRLLARPQMRFLRKQKFVVEPHFHHWPELADSPDGSYLSGYWQSEHYFAAHAQTLRTDFTFKAPLEGLNLEMAEAMRACNAVSLHVRRGDYVHDPKSNAVLGTCSLDYYHRAIARIAESIQAPHFFLFSDDISWVQENLVLDFPYTIVAHNRGTDSYRDMQLMSICRHHIIANSSFSWWGAWLNPRGDKIVVAPKRWFANDNDVRDLFPRGWITI